VKRDRNLGDMPDAYVMWSTRSFYAGYHMQVSRPYVRHDPFASVTWFIHMCDMTHSHVWQDSCMCVPWLMHVSNPPVTPCSVIVAASTVFIGHNSSSPPPTPPPALAATRAASKKEKASSYCACSPRYTSQRGEGEKKKKCFWFRCLGGCCSADNASTLIEGESGSP